MRPPAKLSVIILLAVWLLLALSCETHSGPGQLEYGTLEGDEVTVSCPVDLPPLDPTEWAQILEDSETPAATPWLLRITPLPRETALPAGSLGALLPPDPITGDLPGSCLQESNAEVGCPNCGFADEAQLDRLGRLCGCKVRGGGEDYFSLRADLYLTATGAREAFRMEARTIQGRGFEDVRDVDQARLEGLGDEQTIRLNVYSINGQRAEGHKILLVRWHNITARIELSPYKPTKLLLDYAAQLGSNIEAMVKGSSP